MRGRADQIYTSWPLYLDPFKAWESLIGSIMSSISVYPREGRSRKVLVLCGGGDQVTEIIEGMGVPIDNKNGGGAGAGSRLQQNKGGGVPGYNKSMGGLPWGQFFLFLVRYHFFCT